MSRNLEKWGRNIYLFDFVWDTWAEMNSTNMDPQRLHALHMSLLSFIVFYTRNINFQMNASELTTSANFQITTFPQWFWVLLISRNISVSNNIVNLLITFRNYFLTEILFELSLFTIKEFLMQNESEILRVILNYNS